MTEEMNEKLKKAAETYLKYRDTAEALTDDEIQNAIDVLSDTVFLLDCLGDRFMFATREMGEFVVALRRIRYARKEPKHGS